MSPHGGLWVTVIKRHLNIKHNYTSTKNKLKTNPQNRIEQSYQGLKTEGVRCWAEGQEEEEGKHRADGRGEGPGVAAGTSSGRGLVGSCQALATPKAAGGSPLYWGVNLRISAGRVS